MNLSESLYARLTGCAPVAALVGTRVYPYALPQLPTLPAITYALTSEPTEHCQNETYSRIKRANMRVQCWASSWDGAIALGAVVEDCLDAFCGLLGGATGVRAVVTLTNSVDLGDELPQWKRRILDFEVWYTPPPG